jgi:hypothetical protein
MDAMIARVLKSLLIAGAVLVAGCGCGFAVDDILPVEFRCFSKSAQLYSMTFTEHVTLLEIDHDTETISVFFKQSGENDFQLKLKTPIRDISSISDEKTKRVNDFVLEQMRIIEDICQGKADARARFSEMLRENAYRTNYKK